MSDSTSSDVVYSFNNIINYIEQLNFHQFEMTYKKKEEDNIYLEGKLTIGNKNKHSIIELMPASRLILNNLKSN